MQHFTYRTLAHLRQNEKMEPIKLCSQRYHIDCKFEHEKLMLDR